jgi:hypothetical protein
MAMENFVIAQHQIHCVMPLYVEVVINLKFRGLSEEIMFTCNRQLVAW